MWDTFGGCRYVVQVTDKQTNDTFTLNVQNIVPFGQTYACICLHHSPIASFFFCVPCFEVCGVGGYLYHT